MYELSDFEYDLPEKLIAQKPLKDRASSRLLIVDRRTGAMNITKFNSLIYNINKGDVIVINETKVIPARIYGERNGSKIELFLLREIEENVWEIMVKPGKKARLDDVIYLKEDTYCRIQAVKEDGNRIAVFESKMNFYDYIESFGNMPLPPYIKREAEKEDRLSYQTVFASKPGAVAAPTAGLHFSEDLLDKLQLKGVKIAKVTLHVGAGTFKPIKTDKIKDHKMHSERYELSRNYASVINEARRSGKKVFAVGTTSVRTLETIADDNGLLKQAEGETDIFIYPGYKFKVVDHLITNFHLPKSSLMLLVSAFSSLSTIKSAYDLAIKERMRFFSYGDAMLII